MSKRKLFWIPLSGIVIVALCVLLEHRSSTIPSISPTLVETGKSTSSYEETVHLNNCRGKSEAKETVSHEFQKEVVVNGEVSGGYKSVAEGKVGAKYRRYRNTTKTLQLIAPAGTNMKFVVRWWEDKRTGEVRFSDDGRVYHYEVSIPLSVELVSSEDMGCNNTPTPTPSLTPTFTATPTFTPTCTLTPTVTFTPTITLTPTTTPNPECPREPSLLHPNQKAHISRVPSEANRVRRYPGRRADIIGRAPPGTRIRVLRGPRCVEGYYWWQIEILSTGLVGWTAEGTGEDQWIIPDEP